MKAHAHEFPVAKMSEVLEVSRSGYYKWLAAGAPTCADKDNLDDQIEEAFNDSHQTYGSPRIAQHLCDKGTWTSPSTVARRMQRLNIEARRPKKFIHTTDSDHDHPIAPNVLNRDFDAKCPGLKWVSDLTYFKIGSTWYYLTIILDLADRSIISWTISDNMTSEDTTIATLLGAVKNRKPQPGLIFHSDRGVQYASAAFREQLADLGAVQSMSGKGNCWDNAVAESFFKTIKTECINRHVFLSYDQAWSIIFRYIEGWYNTKRIHTSLNGLTPLQAYEAKVKSEMAA